MFCRTKVQSTIPHSEVRLNCFVRVSVNILICAVTKKRKKEKGREGEGGRKERERRRGREREGEGENRKLSILYLPLTAFASLGYIILALVLVSLIASRQHQVMRSYKKEKNSKRNENKCIS